MSLQNTTISALLGGRPQIEITKTVIRDGVILIDGQMKLTFVPGHGRGDGFSFQAPFTNAGNEDAAVQQGATRLAEIGRELTQVAESLLKIVQKPPTSP